MFTICTYYCYPLVISKTDLINFDCFDIIFFYNNFVKKLVICYDDDFGDSGASREREIFNNFFILLIVYNYMYNTIIKIINTIHLRIYPHSIYTEYYVMNENKMCTYKVTQVRHVITNKIRCIQNPLTFNLTLIMSIY